MGSEQPYFYKLLLTDTWWNFRIIGWPWPCPLQVKILMSVCSLISIAFAFPRLYHQILSTSYISWPRPSLLSVKSEQAEIQFIMRVSWSWGLDIFPRTPPRFLGWCSIIPGSSQSAMTQCVGTCFHVNSSSVISLGNCSYQDFPPFLGRPQLLYRILIFLSFLLFETLTTPPISVTD